MVPPVVSHVYGYQVVSRPRSAPVGRAGPPLEPCHPPFWRRLSVQPKSQARRGVPHQPPGVKSGLESGDSSTEDEGGMPQPRSARAWHVPDAKIQALVEKLQVQEVTPGPVGVPLRSRPVASPCQVNRPLLSRGRLKREKEEATQCSEEEVHSDRDAEAERAAYEAAEMERIKYYFRKPNVSSENSPQEMARCASAPSKPGRSKTARPDAAPRVKVPKLPMSKSEVLLTLNFMDTGDKYTIQVDPDLRVGPGSREQVGVQSLKGIIEEISGIPTQDQVLFCQRCKMGNDRHTLRSYHAHENAEVLVRVQGRRPGFSQACTVKWRQQQQMREQRRDRARAVSASQPKHRVMQCWQSCVVPQNGTFFQYAKRGLEGKLAARFDLQGSGQKADIRTNLFHDPFLSFGDYHTWRPDEGTREWERIRNGPAYNAKLEFEGS
ncbi:unnamed protein product [Durusdinium trenchii]|uniref:Ankyrin-2 n=2 Tax=Durusdinium trenchii TaxID=1381693 RepID=A0ABP0KVA7_9DINO